MHHLHNLLQAAAPLRELTPNPPFDSGLPNLLIMFLVKAMPALSILGLFLVSLVSLAALYATLHALQQAHKDRHNS
jgi:hypothetical protein